MKRISEILFLLILISSVSLFTFLPDALAARKISAQRECATCHIMWLEEFRQKKIEPLIKLQAQPVVIAGKQGVVSTERMCYTCHDGFILDSRFAWKEGKKNFHPIGVTPKKVQIPRRSDGTEPFPLDGNGQVYCGTCHSAHGVDWSTKDSPIFLRESNKDSMMCMICHIDRATGPAEGNHPINKTTINIPKKIEQHGGKTGAFKNQIICQSCHRVHGAAEKKLLIVKNDKSQLCGTCHSDRYAKDLEQANRMSTHPVNITSEKVKIPESIIKKGAKKGPGGEIICQSCHRPHYAVKGRGILISNNTSSNLCKECHDNKKSVLITKHNLEKSAPSAINIKGQTPFRSGPCSVCHLPHRGNGPKMWAQKIVGTEDPLSNMCKSCHSETGAAGKKPIGHNSHPVNKTLKRIGGQSTLPLFNTEGKRLTTPEERVEGKVFCATCHDVHQWNAKNPKIGSGANEEGDATNSFLRIQASPKPDLCANCHKGKTYVFKTDHDLRVTAPEATTAAGKNVAQTGVCGTCHMVHNSPVKAKLWARNISGKGDIIAQLCTSCHTKGGPAEKKLTGRYTHPTGKPVSNINIKILEDGRWTHPYLDALPAKDRPKLTPLPFFDSEGNRVADGNVSCGSCHNPHQWDPNSPKPGKNKNIEGDGTNSFLRIARDPNSALCKNCHVEKRTVAFSKHNLKLMAPGEKNIEGRTAKKTGICSTCHLPHNGRGPKMWARKPDRSGDMVERLCKSCHKKGEVAERKLTGAHSHPLGKSVRRLGIIPSSRSKWKAPDNTLTQGTKEDTIFPLPLYKPNGERTVDGNITCGSCHDPHQWVPGEFEKDALSIKSETFKSALKNFTKKLKSIKKEEGDGRSSFLRMPNAPDSGLCKNCHIDKRSVELTKHNLNIFAKDEKNVQNLSPQESGSCSACHLPHNGTSLKMWARKLPDTKEDKISNLCKSCHSEGQIAEQKTIRDYSHPVFADIDKVGGKTDLPLYSKAGTKTGKKYGGKVVCSTCHDPHRWDPNDIASKAGASKKVEGDATNSFLRIAAYPSPMLCINCHEDKKYVEFTDHDLSITAPDAKNVQGYTVKEAGKCGMCHMIHNSPNPVRLWALEKGPGDDEMERLCRSCHLEGRIAGHKRPRYFNHPPDVKATSNIVRAKKLKGRGKRKQKKSQEVVTGEKIKPMPVYKITGEKVKAGLITCPSCHDPHNWSAIEKGYGPGKNTEGNNTNSFLRSMSNMAICSDCHGFDGIFRYKYYHGPSSRDKSVPMRGTAVGIE